MTGNKPDLVARAKRFLEKPENKPNCEECIEKYGLDKKVLWHCPEGKKPESCEKANKVKGLGGLLSQAQEVSLPLRKEPSLRKPKIYLASSFRYAKLVSSLSERLEKKGFEITQKWWLRDYKKIAVSDDEWYKREDVRAISDQIQASGQRGWRFIWMLGIWVS